MPDTFSIRDLGAWRGGATPSKALKSYWANGCVPWVTPKDMQGTEISDSQDRLSQEGANRLCIFKPGDIAVVFRSGILRRLFPVAAASVPFTVNQDLKVLQPGPTFDARFAFHTLRAAAPTVVATAVKSGTTVESVDPTLFFSIRVFGPPLPEQRKIAEVLDTLDEAIRKTEQIIAKLKQVKQGLLHDLLTRGIDHNGELRDPDRHPEQFKDSELGRIPKEWEVATLVSRIDVKGGKRLPAGHDYRATPGACRYLRVLDFYRRTVQWDDVLFLEESTFQALQRYEVRPGDLIISIAGSLGFAGEYAPPLGFGRAILTENAARLIPRVELNRGFVVAQINSSLVQSQIAVEMGVGGGVPKLALFRIESLMLRWPSLDEQAEISKRLSAIDSRAQHEAGTLAKLALQKKGLMEDLLTGKVRVTPLLDGKAG